MLAFQEGMTSIWLRYQGLIGHDKMYPSITGFELDMEDKCLVKQILECFLRLTADRWQARAWNRYDAFTEFCKERGKKNLGQELHGNRFGDHYVAVVSGFTPSICGLTSSMLGLT